MTIENLHIQLKNNSLEYRSKLTIPEKINFGLELELDQINHNEVLKIVRKEIDTYIDNFYKIYLLEGDELLKSDKALNLFNMIFPHKEDQLYFMHQYLGKQK